MRNPEISCPVLGKPEYDPARYRNGARKVEFEGGVYMRPTIVQCDSFHHPLSNKEFLCPYASVVEVPQIKMLEQIGYSLAVTAITRDKNFIDTLMEATNIDRLNIGPISTMKSSFAGAIASTIRASTLRSCRKC